MYQDLSFMRIPLPEDVLKLKIYGDYAGAQKMIRDRKSVGRERVF